MTRAAISYVLGVYLLVFEVPTIHGSGQVAMIGAALYLLGLPSALMLNALPHASGRQPIIFGYYRQENRGEPDRAAQDAEPQEDTNR